MPQEALHWPPARSLSSLLLSAVPTAVTPTSWVPRSLLAAARLSQPFCLLLPRSWGGPQEPVGPGTEPCGTGKEKDSSSRWSHPPRGRDPREQGCS